MRVFISHSSKDKPQVEALAVGLRQRGIDPWFDKWEILPGDDIVASINAGLDQADAGIVVISKHALESDWVNAEINSLTHSRIEEHQILIPVVVGEDVWIPPLLRSLARRRVDEIDAIADGLLRRRGGPPLRPSEQGAVEDVLISLRPADPGPGVQVQVGVGEREAASIVYPAIPGPLLDAQRTFLRGFRTGLRRNPVAAERGALESTVADLGRRLGAFCLPGEAGRAVAELLQKRPVIAMALRSKSPVHHSVFRKMHRIGLVGSTVFSWVGHLPEIIWVCSKLLSLGDDLGYGIVVNNHQTLSFGLCVKWRCPTRMKCSIQ